MQTNPTAIHSPHSPVVTERPLHADWIRTGVISGFFATFSMTVCLTLAYWAANALGDANGNTFERWFKALSQNELTQNIQGRFFFGMILNLLMGLVWALIYARFAEPRLSGPGIWRGMVFSIIPFILSVVVFFPIAGIGIFGASAGAGALPAIGSLILHLVYGAVLGTIYAIDVRAGLSSAAGESEAAESAERGMAIGIVIGTVLGFIGGWIVGPGVDTLATRPVIGIAGALSGAAIGMMIGSFTAMRTEEKSDH